MIARLLVVVAFIAGSAALALGFLSPFPEAVQAQSDADLVATIAVLQTQVADQEERLDELEDTQQALLFILALGNASEGLPVVPTSTPRPTQRPEPTAHKIYGTVILARPGQYFVEDATSCKAVTLYRDIADGATVSIYNGGDTLIGKTPLGRGIIGSQGCIFRFVIDVVDQTYYRFEIGDLDVGLFSETDMVSEQSDIEIVIQ